MSRDILGRIIEGIEKFLITDLEGPRTYIDNSRPAKHRRLVDRLTIVHPRLHRVHRR